MLRVLTVAIALAFAAPAMAFEADEFPYHGMRVMATPQWPVPYYQRAFRHPANLDRNDGDLGYFMVPISDAHVMVAKELLKLEGKGYVVEAVEQHYDIDNYMTRFEDSDEFSKAYVDDLLDCLGAAREQDVKLLGEHDFSDVFN